MAENIDLEEFIKFQVSERYKAFILYGLYGSGKTGIAKKIADNVEGEYISLPEEFYKNKELKKNIEIFGPEKLKKYLLGIKTYKELIIIDETDFILNTWTNTEKMEFLNMVEKLSNVETNHIFMFILQYDSFLETKEITNTRGESRIIDIARVSKIGGLNDD